jgi:hypothetical protein
MVTGRLLQPSYHFSQKKKLVELNCVVWPFQAGRGSREESGSPVKSFKQQCLLHHSFLVTNHCNITSREESPLPVF